MEFLKLRFIPSSRHHAAARITLALCLLMMSLAPAWQVKADAAPAPAQVVLDTVAATFAPALPPLPRADFQPATRIVDGQRIEGFAVIANETAARPSSVIRQTSSLHSQFSPHLVSPSPPHLVPFLPATLTDPIIIAGDGARVTLAAEDANPSQAQRREGKLVYAGSYPYADTFFTVGDGRVEEFILLHSPQAPTTFRYRILAMDGVTTLRERDGVIEFLDAEGRARLRIAKPYLVDGAGQRHDDRLTWNLIADRLTLRLDAADLRYPVLVDPEWESPWAYYNDEGYIGGEMEGHGTATLLLDARVLVINCYGEAILYDPATDTWEPTGAMNEARENFDAILLEQGTDAGKVLVIGGVGNTSAELYDPASGTWSYTGAMNEVRYEGWSLYRHPAVTTLADGRVLVTGGYNGVDYLDTAEIYDPQTGSWSYTASLMNETRCNHTATLLPDGQVLVAGDYGYYASAEIYDPVADNWSVVTSMNHRRQNHTATLLSNGQVLVSGGGTDSAELYDPVTGTWQDTEAMDTGHTNHTATLLPDGTVLVVGDREFDPPLEGKEIVEQYDPISDTWQTVAPMHYPRSHHDAVLLPDGRVLVTSGLSNHVIEIYDPATDTWDFPGQTMRRARQAHTTTTLPDDEILVTGGCYMGAYEWLLIRDCWDRFDPTVEVYDPKTQTWRFTAPMNSARVEHTATMLPNGQLLITGGYTGRDGYDLIYTTTTEIYAPMTETWRVTGSMNQGRAYHTATLLPDGTVLVTGGGGSYYFSNSGDTLATAEIYDPATGMWDYTGSMNMPRSGHTATLLPNGTVLVAGGSIIVGITATEIYNPITKRWTPAANMQHAKSLHTATLLPDGRVLVAGGGASEVYDPETNTWTMALPMNANRLNHTATLLPGGEVLVVGGFVQDDIGDRPEVLKSAEIIDPFAPTPAWTPISTSLQQQRTGHTATLLSNNKVLIAAGGGKIAVEIRDSAGWEPESWPAQNTVEHFNQTYSEHLARGDWLIPQGRDYRTAFHAELGGPASVTISDTLAAYHDGGYAYLTMAENSYYAALQRAADITETHQALMGLLDTRWEQASGAMLSGNEFMVQALDIIYTSPTSPLDEEIGQLEEAVDWYTLATDGYIELLATEHFTQFMALQPARVHPVSNQPTPYLDLQRLALASAKKSRAYLEIAERQFHKFMPASKEAAEATLRAALPIAISELKLLHDVWPDANADASVQALRRNISDMQRLHRYLQEGKNPFGYGPAYVPFYFQPKHWPNNNFEQTMDLAQAELAVARDLVNYAQGRQEESDDNYVVLQQRLYDVGVQYDNQLAQLCGTNAVGEPDLAGCHKNESGEFYRQLLRVEAASERIDLVEQQMANQLALIEIEEERVAKVNNIHRATAEMYTQTGEKLANLATEEAKLRRQQVEIQNRIRENAERLRRTESMINATTSMLNPNPLAAIGGLIQAGSLAAVHTTSPIADGQELENIQTKLGDLNAKRERLRAFQSAYVQYAQADINTANSEATIKQYYLRFAEYDIELNIAMNNLQQAASQLNGLLTQIEYLMAEKAKAEAFTAALYQDPAGRVLRDYYMELASDRYDVALRYAWQAGRALEYELNQDVRFDGGPLTDLDSLYRLRDVYSLEAALAQMNTAYHDFLARTDVPSPQQREDVIYLSQALGFEDAYDPDLGRIVTREEKFNAFVRDPANRDAAGNLRFTFPTAIHLGNQSFSTAVFNDKIVSVQMRLWGNNLGDDRAVIHLKQDGTSFIRTLDAFSEAEYVQTPAGETVCTPVDSVREYNIHPLKASVMAATNLNTLPDSVAINQELATRSVAFTNWTLTLDVVNEPNNFDVDIDNIEEIELIITHEAYTLQHDNPCSSTTSATTARTPETLRSFFAGATTTEIEPTLAAPWGARFEPPENREYVPIGDSP